MKMKSWIGRSYILEYSRTFFYLFKSEIRLLRRRWSRRRLEAVVSAVALLSCSLLFDEAVIRVKVKSQEAGWDLIQKGEVKQVSVSTRGKPGKAG